VRYLFMVFAIPAISYFSAVFLVRMPSYPSWSGYPDSPLLTFAFEARGQNADVVIYGDSSANHNIDPSQMAAALGVRVVDLPSNLSVLVVAGDLPLRHYLEGDTPPKVIILYLAAWDLDYRDIDVSTIPAYTGMDVLARYGSANQILSFVEAHPATALQFPFMFYRANFGLDRFQHQDLLRHEVLQLSMTNGHADSVGTSRAESSCVIQQALIDRIRRDGIEELVKKYANFQTKVLVFVASVPSCTNAQSVIDQVRDVLPSAHPKIMPASLFVNDDYYVHLYPEGVAAATEDLIDVVRPLLDASPAR